MIRCFSFFLLLTVASAWASAPLAAQTTVRGTVRGPDEQPVIGASVLIVGTQNGTITNAEGYFKLEMNLQEHSALRISSVGFEAKDVEVTEANPKLDITLREAFLQTDEVVISASRVEENIMRSPVTVQTLKLAEIQASPATNVYDAVANLKGVDQITTSLTFKTLNTRGFNAPANSRFVQRIDGVDMQAPGLNMPTGALSGATDLDVARVELLPGASSALYGPNAFNGMMNIHTKDPFEYPGLSASVKVGANHLNSPQVNPQLFTDMAVRYAKTFGRRFGAKMNIAFVRGTDWYATNYEDRADYSGTENLQRFDRGPGNPGYDGLNIYGDEVSSIVDSTVYPPQFWNQFVPIFLEPALAEDSLEFRTEPTRIARTGYREVDLIDYGTYSARGDLSLYYRFNENTQLEWTSRASQGTSILQADSRISLNNFVYHSHRLELSGKDFFIRAYGTFEDAGDSYDTRFAAMNINRMAKSDEQWFAQYNSAYFGIVRAFDNLDYINPPGGSPLPFDAAAARAFADGDNNLIARQIDSTANSSQLLGALQQYVPLMQGEARIQPGTPDFESALAEVREDPDWRTGAKFVDNSQLYHVAGQYSLRSLLDNLGLESTEVIAGGNYRMFRLDSDGLIFADTNGPRNVPEYGMYAQATQELFDDRVKLIASGRYDKTQDLEGRFTPRLAGVVSLGPERSHNFRASYQTGFKLPDLRNRYVDLDLGPVRVIGGFDSYFEKYGLSVRRGEDLVPNAYTLQSAQTFRRTGDSTVLQPLEMREIRPEFVQAIDIGYKGSFFQRLMLDLNVYHNRYENFIGSIDFVGPQLDEIGTPEQEITLEELRRDSVQRLRRYVNATEDVESYGAAAGLHFFLTRQYAISGNYSYNTIATSEEDLDGLRTEFNTPDHKFNVGFSGRGLWWQDRFGFNIRYRWVDSYLFQYGFGNGVVPSYATMDAKVTYRMPKMRTVMALGGTNILNDRHVEMDGGPTVGTMVYLQLTYDQFLN